MTPFRGRPEFPPLVAAVRAGDDAAVAALWDLLEESGATTADVMTLYALPPAWPGSRRCQVDVTEEVVADTRGAAAEHARRQLEALLAKDGFRPTSVRCDRVPRHSAWRFSGEADPPPPAEDDSLRPLLAAWADRHGPPGRAADVWWWCVYRGEDVGAGWWVTDRANGRLRDGRNTHLGSYNESAARRELKRRVLNLFPDVRVPCPACDGAPRPRGGAWGNPRRGDGACAICGGRGTVAPADLIPPEEGVPVTQDGRAVGRARDFRQVGGDVHADIHFD